MSKRAERICEPAGLQGRSRTSNLETAEVLDDSSLETSGFMADAQNVKPKPA